MEKGPPIIASLARQCNHLQSYWTTTKLWKLTLVLDYCEAMAKNEKNQVRSQGARETPANPQLILFNLMFTLQACVIIPGLLKS